ncbi:MAG: prephenate dehydratase [Clostridiales bacterium]|jgi:chorismate mutase/prephenate dehydratase|nr:prephenate dehydratase [Clostridiales bacterium]
MNLQELRNEIDKVDREILNLFVERMGLCEKVAQYKIENSLPVFQGNREQDIINNIKKNVPKNLSNGAVALFYNIMDISKCIQQEKLLDNDVFMKPLTLDLTQPRKVGCQGTYGSNSEMAAKILFDKSEINFYHEFEDVFKAVENSEVDFGILPIQNSTTGSVAQTYDLMKKYNFYIVKVVRLEISHCLAAKKGTSLSDIKAVYSHPQALWQCSAFISKNNLTAIPHENTATAAKLVSESDEPIAAICSKRCAELYGFDIISDKITDSYPNYTRFICISRDFRMDEDAKSISMLITLPNKQGSLIRLLTKFFVNGFNLEKIESRPIAGGSFNVMFYLDFEGNIHDKKVSALLSGLKGEFESFKFLGNYSEIM